MCCFRLDLPRVLPCAVASGGGSFWLVLATTATRVPQVTAQSAQSPHSAYEPQNHPKSKKEMLQIWHKIQDVDVGDTVAA